MIRETNNSQEQYKAFEEKKEELSVMLKRSSEIISKLNMNNFENNLRMMSEKIKNDSFKIQVVGTFKNGKSTFINSFLGERVLPAYARPTTAVINEVKYGETKAAKLYFRNPLPQKLPESLPDAVIQHIQKYGQTNLPPIDVPYTDIEKYVVIPMGEDPEELLKESPYEKLELFWPLELLKNGIEIIDSPGLNECEVRTRVTMDYLTKADAILFVLRADALCGQAEMDFIENNLHELGFEDQLFFIVNRFDLISRGEQDDIRKYADMKLKNFSKKIYFLSSQKALDGKTENDAEKFAESGVGEFEKDLSDYLTNNRGKAKFKQPAKEMANILNRDAVKVIRDERKRLDSSLDDVKARYEKIKPILGQLQQKKVNLKTSIDNQIRLVLPPIKQAVTRHYIDISDMIPSWVDESQPQTKLGIIPNKEKAEKAAGEITDYVMTKIEEMQSDWKKNVFVPLLEEKSQVIFDKAEKGLEDIYKDIDKINITVSGEDDLPVNNVPTWKRVAGVLGGLALGDVVAAFSGGVNGIGMEFVKTLAFEVGAGFILGFLGLFNPVTFIGTVIAIALMNIFKANSNAMNNLKKELAKNMVNQINDGCGSNTEKIVGGVSEKFNELEAQIIKAVDIEIDETDSQIRSVISEMEKGQANIDRRKEELNDCEAGINDLSEQLHVFTISLI